METSNKLGCEGKATSFHKEYLPKTSQKPYGKYCNCGKYVKLVLPLGRRQGCLV